MRLRHSRGEEYQLCRKSGTRENTLSLTGGQVGNVSIWKRDINTHTKRGKGWDWRRSSCDKHKTCNCIVGTKEIIVTPGFMCTYKHLACLHVLWAASDICFLYACALVFTVTFYIVVLVIIIDLFSLNDFQCKVVNILNPKLGRCNTFLYIASLPRSALLLVFAYVHFQCTAILARITAK